MCTFCYDSTRPHTTHLEFLINFSVETLISISNCIIRLEIYQQKINGLADIDKENTQIIAGKKSE